MDTGLGEEGKDLHSSKSLVNYVEMTFEQLQVCISLYEFCVQINHLVSTFNATDIIV
jgi:hypothetical protein